MQTNESAALDTRCSELHIEQIIESIENWEELAPYFSLTRVEQEEIKGCHAHQYKLQKRRMLWKWVEKNGNKATYRAMKEIFLQAKKALLADKLEEIIQDPYSQSPHRAVAIIKQYLEDCYRCTSATSSGEGEWPQFTDSPFVNPQLVSKNEKVDIKSLFQERGCQKVLLQGVAGSGKTTLTRHICQQWAEGKLLRDVDLLIHLTLADPTLWSAHSLENMIPHPTAEICKAVADVIVEQGGKRCCFVMDGWEDLPDNMQQSSFVRTFLVGKKPGVALPHCSFIVTSRPIASASLKPLVTTTVEITGFSSENIDSYATQYLTQQGKDPTVFITALNNNPPTRGLSSIPINAAILLHLFLTIQTGLPTTQTELFRCFVLNLLLRHLVSKTDHPLLRLHGFSDLPEQIGQSFYKLCIIAHYATFSGKTASKSSQLLSSGDLSQAGLQDFQETLGLMKVHQQLTWFGYDPHYGFLHSSVQDFLCAVRMSQLSAEEQVRDFQHIVSNNPTSLILPFYAGITKLGNEGVCKYLQSKGMKPPNELTIYHELDNAKSEADDPRRLFLAYLHCLYEVNRQDLLVEPSIAHPDIVNFKYESVSVAFDMYRLSVHDLNVIFFFVLDLGKICYPSVINFSFDTCSVDDHGIETAVATLTNRAHTHYHSFRTGNIDLEMPSNNLTHKGVGAIVSVCYLFRTLDLTGNLHSPSSNGFIALKLLIEAMSSSSATQLVCLILNNWKLTSRHAYHLVLLITQARNLEYISISYNQLQESVPLLVSAAKNLKVLNLYASGIGDTEICEVGLILQSNTNMETLHISSRSDIDLEPVNFEAVSRFIERIVAPVSQSRLQVLYIHSCHMEHLRCDMNIQNAMNRFASSRGFPLYITSLVEVDSVKHYVHSYGVLSSIPSPLLHGE